MGPQNNNSQPGVTAINDFQTNSFMGKKIPQHDRDINNLKKRVTALEERLGDNEKFAKSFSECLETQALAQSCLQKRFSNMIETDSIAREAMSKFVRSDHLHNVLAFLKSFGGALFWVIVGAAASYFIPKIFGN